MKVPLLYSSKATFSSACVFITMGPRQATGSPMGFPETSRNRTDSSPALTATWSPSEKRIRLGGKFDLTDLQQKILEILKETGGAPPAHLVERLNISPMDLEREIAALRHMEKVRGELRSGKKYIRLW